MKLTNRRMYKTCIIRYITNQQDQEQLIQLKTYNI